MITIIIILTNFISFRFVALKVNFAPIKDISHYNTADTPISYGTIFIQQYTVVSSVYISSDLQQFYIHLNLYIFF